MGLGEVLRSQSWHIGKPAYSRAPTHSHILKWLATPTPPSCSTSPFTATSYKYTSTGPTAATNQDTPTISWSGNTGTFTLDNLVVGAYTVAVAACNANGCSTSDPSASTPVGASMESWRRTGRSSQVAFC